MSRPILLAFAAALVLASAAAAQVKLEPKRLEGKLSTVSTIRTKQKLTLAGMDIETESESVAESSTEIGKREPDGTVRIRQKTDALRVNLTLPGPVRVQFDSAKPEARSDNPQIQTLLDMYRALSKASYTLVAGKDNKLTAVEGLEKVTEGAPAPVVEALRKELIAERLIKASNQERARYPDGPVKIGDRWTRAETMNLGGGQTLAFETYYEYQGTTERSGRTLDKIGVFIGSVTYSLAPDAPVPVKVVRSDLKIESSSGTLLFDRERGMPVESASTTRIKGLMTLSLNGMELPGEVDLTLEIGAVTK